MTPRRETLRVSRDVTPSVPVTPQRRPRCISRWPLATALTSRPERPRDSATAISQSEQGKPRRNLRGRMTARSLQAATTAQNAAQMERASVDANGGPKRRIADHRTTGPIGRAATIRSARQEERIHLMSKRGRAETVRTRAPGVDRSRVPRSPGYDQPTPGVRRNESASAPPAEISAARVIVKPVGGPTRDPSRTSRGGAAAEHEGEAARSPTRPAETDVATRGRQHVTCATRRSRARSNRVQRPPWSYRGNNSGTRTKRFGHRDGGRCEDGDARAFWVSAGARRDPVAELADPGPTDVPCAPGRTVVSRRPRPCGPRRGAAEPVRHDAGAFQEGALPGVKYGDSKSAWSRKARRRCADERCCPTRIRGSRSAAAVHVVPERRPPARAVLAGTSARSRAVGSRAAGGDRAHGRRRRHGRLLRQRCSPVPGVDVRSSRRPGPRPRRRDRGHASPAVGGGGWRELG